jgi:hypothetical protein
MDNTIAGKGSKWNKNDFILIASNISKASFLRSSFNNQFWRQYQK